MRWWIVHNYLWNRIIITFFISHYWLFLNHSLCITYSSVMLSLHMRTLRVLTEWLVFVLCLSDCIISILYNFMITSQYIHTSAGEGSNLIRSVYHRTNTQRQTRIHTHIHTCWNTQRQPALIMEGHAFHEVFYSKYSLDIQPIVYY